MTIRTVAIILVLFNLSGCGDTYANFGKINWWIKPFLKKVTVMVYDRQKEIEFIAGTFKTNFGATEKIWDACRELADSYAKQNKLSDWEYHCCGKTFWSECVRI